MLRLTILFFLIFTFGSVVKASASGIANELKKVSVDDYGANANDDLDDTEAFQSALEYIKNHKHNKFILELSEGTYFFTSFNETNDRNKRAHIFIDKTNYLLIKGRNKNTHLVMTDPEANGIFIQDSSMIELSNVSIDYQPLPFTQGKIVDVDLESSSIIFSIDSNYSSPLSDYLIDTNFRKNRLYTFEENEDRILEQRFIRDFYPQFFGDKKGAVRKLPNGLFEFRTVNALSKDLVGLSFALVGRSKFDAIQVLNSRAVTMDSISIFSSPSTGFKLKSNTESIKIKNSQIKIRPKSGRLISTNADGLHAKFNRGPVILIDSVMEGMADDAVNISGKYLPIYSQVDRKTLIVAAHKSFNVGDRISITDVKSGKVLSYSSIQKLDRITTTDGKVAIRIVTSTDVYTNNTLTKGLDESLANQITSLDSNGERSIIINNHFSGFRSRAIMLHSENSIVMNNSFTSFRGPGIVVGPDFSWGEASNGSGAFISNNIFSNINKSNILIKGSDYSEDVQSSSTSNITIEGNLFSDYGNYTSARARGDIGPAISIENAKDIRVNLNRFGPQKYPNTSLPIISIHNTKNLEFFNNRFGIDNFPPKKLINKKIVSSN